MYVKAVLQVLWIVVIVSAVFIEQASGMYGLVFAFLFLYAQRSSVVMLSIATVFAGLLGDVLYVTPLGLTPVLFFFVWFVWFLAKGKSRGRFILYMVLGLVQTLVLFRLREQQVSLILLAGVLVGAWVIGKRLYSPAAEGVHLRSGS